MNLLSRPSGEEGQVLVFGALALTMLLGLVGLVIDGGFYYTTDALKKRVSLTLTPTWDREMSLRTTSYPAFAET